VGNTTETWVGWDIALLRRYSTCKRILWQLPNLKALGRDLSVGFLQVLLRYLNIQENWANSGPATQERANIAEKLDALWVPYPGTG
jgi:hypothetical protein